MHRRDLSHAVGPGPVRKDMDHGKVRAPAGLVDIEAVLLEAGQINNAKVGAAGAIIASVRRRLANIVKAGPDKLAGHVGEVVLAAKDRIRAAAPAGVLELVGGDIHVRAVRAAAGAVPGIVAARDGEQVRATAANT